ncbi:MAG: hypothetical protein K6G44_02900 [Lentisphaeria bacterium]|nr:hypothetical protein [Lentisphaeria bacterium]
MILIAEDSKASVCSAVITLRASENNVMRKLKIHGLLALVALRLRFPKSPENPVYPDYYKTQTRRGNLKFPRLVQSFCFKL